MRPTMPYDGRAVQTNRNFKFTAPGIEPVGRSLRRSIRAAQVSIKGRAMRDLMRQALTSLGAYVASPIAFFVVAAYVALWGVLNPDSLDWHAGATIATWFMTLVIQRAEHRDTQAIHAKLDEIVHALGGARDEVAHIDDHEPEEIEEHREGTRRKE